MSHEVSPLTVATPDTKSRGGDSRMFYIGFGMATAFGCSLLMAVSFYTGRLSVSDQGLGGIPANRMHPELLSASASHGGANMAVCTAPVDENAEGFFALDYLTGDLKGWVYYPRRGVFGGLFATNVSPALGGIQKNAEYLLVSGGAASPPTGSNVRAAASLLYVVDTKSGQFAAYTIPWSRAGENAGAAQLDTFVLVGGDSIRPPFAGGAGRGKPAPPPNNPKPNNQNPNAQDPNNPDPNNPNPNNNLNPNNPRPNNNNRPKNPGNN